jgi:L-2-hydroxyglutarate oxidase LhgO
MIAIVGAGVVGLSCARALARRGADVCVLERHGRPGLETSTHNSGVVHAGLYYPAGTLKARLSVEGRERLYAFAAEHGVPHVRCGKLVVAGRGEAGALEAVARQAAENGARVELVDRAFVAAREPYVAADAALWSPDTGWIDAHALVRALADDVRRSGGALVAGAALVGAEPGPSGGFTLATPRERIDASRVVNAAGLHADDVSTLLGGARFAIHPCRGEYAALRPRARHLVRGLVYPVPDPSGHGLGVHLTRTIGGEVWIGPTIRYQDDKTDYERDRLPLEAFLEPTRRLLPAVTLEDLRLGGSGIRPKLHPPAERFADFLIGPDARNPALVQVAGIDSPGLTACLAIGEHVAGLLV